MTNFKDEWTVETAIKIMEHQTVDSKTWSEAIEWLMLYGPVEIKELIGESFGIATKNCFPDLKPDGYDPDGHPCYEINTIATSLQIDKKEAAKILSDKETSTDTPLSVDNNDISKIQ